MFAVDEGFFFFDRRTRNKMFRSFRVAEFAFEVVEGSDNIKLIVLRVRVDCVATFGVIDEVCEGTYCYCFRGYEPRLGESLALNVFDTAYE